MILQNLRNRFEPIALTLLRISTGIIMTAHGWEKMMAISSVVETFQKLGIPNPEIAVYLAIAGEFFGGLGLLVGLLTPLAASGIFCTMVIAVFQVHGPNGLLAKNNGFEYPLTLLLVSLFFMIKGGGPFSLDALCFKKCCKKEST